MKEREIRPKELFDKLLDLAKKDSKIIFKNSKKINIKCIACESKNTNFEFTKNTLAYSRCHKCKTLFVNPRPKYKYFDNFYKSSQSAKFWSETFFPTVSKVRKKKILTNKVKTIIKYFANNSHKINNIVDVGAGYGHFLMEFKKLQKVQHAIAIEPSLQMANFCKIKKLIVYQNMIEEIKKFKIKADLLTCFEVIEHSHNPYKFIKKIKSLVKKNGYILFTTLCIDGFDLKLLGKNSDQITPPHHINFFSKQGITKLLKRLGFSKIDILTPGKLDVDIVKNYYRDKNIIVKDKFYQEIFQSEELSKKFQTFLVNNKLSSHLWVIARNN